MQGAMGVQSMGVATMTRTSVPRSCLCGVEARSALKNKVGLLGVLPTPGKLDYVCLQASKA